MKLTNILEGDVSAANDRIVSIKNDLIRGISTELESMGFDDTRIRPSETTSDDALLYIETGYGIGESQIVMIRVSSDDNIQIQLPTSLASYLGVRDYYKEASASNALARLQLILGR